MIRRVFVIGDDPNPFELAVQAIRELWPNPEVTWIIGQGYELLSRYVPMLGEALPAGDSEIEACVVLDINWGPHYHSAGCQVLHWLRETGRRYPVLLHTNYLYGDYVDGSLGEQLTREMNWIPFSPREPRRLAESDLRHLTAAEAAQARRSVVQHLRSNLHDFGHLCDACAAGRAQAWDALASIASRYEPFDENDPPTLSETWPILQQALNTRDVTLLRQAFDSYRTLYYRRWR